MDWFVHCSDPSQTVRQLRTLLEARDGLVELRTKVKNMGHGVLIRNGVSKGRAAFALERGRQQLLRLPGLPAVEQVMLQSVCVRSMRSIKNCHPRRGNSRAWQIAARP